MININDIIEINIIDLNHLGQGVGKLSDFVVFVDGAITGDYVKAQVTEIKKSFALAKTLEIIKSSSHRVNSPCARFELCGGCQTLSMSYEEQLNYKKNSVINSLKKSSLNMDDIIIYDTIGMDNPYRYRNKTAFSVGKKNGKIQIGTYEQSTHQLVDLDACLLQDEVADNILKCAKAIFEKYKISPYDQISKTGTIRHIVIRTNKYKEVMLIIVTNTEVLPNSEKVVDDFINAVPNIKTIVQNINNKSGSVILGYKNKTLYGSGTIVDYIENLKFVISPHTFFQVNSVQTEKLYEKAIEYADIYNEDICFDLYCGIGTISLMASKKAKKVYGVEIVEQSIKDAEKNAKLNSINNTEFYTGKVEVILPKLYKKSIKADIIIIDPPRKGCEKEVLDAINNIKPKKVVYVSCNPATLGRDLKILQDYGFKIEKVQPVDMFCHSTHVETVARLVRKTPDAYIDLKVDMDELDLTASEAKATYEKIKQYILEKYDTKVTNLYIAQVKEKYGIIERENYNKPKSADARQPQCPPEKVKMIEEALHYFKMI